MKTETINEQFAADVKAGLSARPKCISSKYFYDERGDRIFRAIMHMKEYYPTTCEYEIFTMQKESILQHFLTGGNSFDLVEFGAGDGYKTKVLLRYFIEEQVDVNYVPIDISANALLLLKEDLEKNLPGTTVEGVQGEYFSALKKLNEPGNKRKVILFLGSNVGNFSPRQAIDFLTKLGANMSADDQVLIGFDLKKDPRIILEAYDDRTGITKTFNLNLLRRINKELGGNFNEHNFDHFPLYDPLSGTTKSFLVSKIKQSVFIEALEMEISFDAWETIHTEISQKFDLPMIHQLAVDAGFEIVENFFDCKRFYVDSLWKLKKSTKEHHHSN